MSPSHDDQPDPLARLNRLNPTLVVIGTVVLFLAIVLLPDLLAGILLIILAGGLLWLLRRTWPVLPTSQRVLRASVIGLLVIIALIRLLL